MKKEFVTHEIALALKELGFDEECLAVFSDDKYFDLIHVCENQTEGNFVIESFQYGTKAPLWQQAFRWFRVKHNLDSWIYSPNESKGYFAIILKDKRFVSYNEQFDTYEEAELACLNKLIEIVKNGNNS